VTTIDEFRDTPFTKVHETYENSFLYMRPSVEMASGEVLLASTYRAVGSNQKMEGGVPKSGRGLLRLIAKGKRPKGASESTGIEPDDWRVVLQDTLRSPKQPNQSARQFLQISPLVPDTALYSLSARLTANSWNPGDLVKKLVQFGSDSIADANDLWDELFCALNIDCQDDVWAQFLDREFRSWRTQEHEHFFQSASALQLDEAIDAWHVQNCVAPARQFCRDLKAIISLKPQLTRRQWITLLESVIRLGAATHTMWLGAQNKAVADLLYAAILGAPSKEFNEESYRVRPLLKIDQFVSAQLKIAAVDAEKARLKINLLLIYLTEKFGEAFTTGALASINSVNEFARKLPDALDKSERARLMSDLQDLLEVDTRRFQCKTGRAKNIVEFLQHSLQQRQTSEVGLEPYDQGYFLRKRGAHRSARWEVALGPVAVIALVYCCTQGSPGNANMDDLLEHLERYGIELDPDNREVSSLVATLRGLGLVLDSPDAEGGMALISPFEKADMLENI
jgi:hypothetical protein